MRQRTKRTLQKSDRSDMWQAAHSRTFHLTAAALGFDLPVIFTAEKEAGNCDRYVSLSPLVARDQSI